MTLPLHRMIVLPIDQIEYDSIIDSRPQYRAKLNCLIARYPELFPPTISQGYHFVGLSKNHIKLPIKRRIIRIKNPLNNYDDYLLHPCFIMPYLRGEKRRHSRATARLFNEVQGKIIKVTGSTYYCRITKCQALINCAQFCSKVLTFIVLILTITF